MNEKIMYIIASITCFIYPLLLAKLTINKKDVYCIALLKRINCIFILATIVFLEFNIIAYFIIIFSFNLMLFNSITFNRKMVLNYINAYISSIFLFICIKNCDYFFTIILIFLLLIQNICLGLLFPSFNKNKLIDKITFKL
jgi:hypothetical protein